MNDVTEQLTSSLGEFLAFARGRLRDPELAADVVQESLLKALRHQGRLRDEASAKAWFYRILRRTIVDLHRQRDAQRQVLERVELELDATPNEAEERAVCACLERLLPALKPEHATLLRRLDLNGEASASVAASLGITRNNLMVRLHRARRQLRERLEQTCRLCATHGCLDCQCDQPAKPRN